MTTSEAGIDFLDADTVRRLVKLDAKAGASDYPVLEQRDGFPEGVVIQWSLPMDWVIESVDAVAPELWPNARRFETGAALAGPLLGVLAVIAFALLVWRLLPPGQAALAAVLYASSAPGVEVTRLGNGDHQSLQLLCVVIAILGCLVLLAGKGGRPLAWFAGGILGLSLWVNAESMLALIIDGLAIWVVLSLSTAEHVARQLPRLLQFAIACAVVSIVGERIENAGALTLEWDRISGFQVAASLGLVAFVGLAIRLLPRFGQPAKSMSLAAGISAALVAGPFLLVPGLRAALFAELARMATFAGFCRACVNEYQPLFADGIGLARIVYGDVLWLIPPCFIGLVWARSLVPSLRAGFAIPAVLLGGLVLNQVKLAHMFAIPWAMLLPVGGAGLLDRIAHAGWIPAARMPRVRWLAGVLVAALALWHILSLALSSVPAGRDGRHEVVAAIRDLEFSPDSAIAAERVAVMAPWDLGHYLLYETDKPIIASSYQRRVDGIRASFEVACSPPDRAHEILKQHRVRWWVRPGAPKFLTQYHQVVPGAPQLARSVDGPDGPRIGLSPAVRETLWARTAPGEELPEWLDPVFDTKSMVFGAPEFRVFRVEY
ncbi:MAG TPA: hypothetical protein ENI87_04125 [bacterium]|nr:hypothetical protein [bacterium]